MLKPKYTITEGILKNVGVVEAAREVIESAALIPAYQKSFQNEALLRTVHFGTHIEGNELSLEEARKIVEGPAFAPLSGATAGEGREAQEVINYRRVMEYLEEAARNREALSPFVYTAEQLLKIHTLAVERILPSDFLGKLRTVEVVAKDSQTGKTVFQYPPAVEVSYYLDDFFAWLNGEQGRTTHPVLRSAITHYILAAVHPFTEGNGRVARAFATLVLFCEGYEVKRLFSLEEYFDREAKSYFEALLSVSRQNSQINERDLTSWLEFFCQGLASELLRVKEKVKKLSFDGRFREKLGNQVVLSERQIRLLEYLEGPGEMTMLEAKEALPMVSEDTILRELKELLKKGIIKKKGKTKGAKYHVIN